MDLFILYLTAGHPFLAVFGNLNDIGLLEGYTMGVQAGYIQKYNSDKGYGFIADVFGYSTNTVFFHINTIKKCSRELAKKVDENDFEDIILWYETEPTEKGCQVSIFWGNAEEIPTDKKKKLASLIESKWTRMNIFLRFNKVLPQVEKATSELLGSERLSDLREKVSIKPEIEKNTEAIVEDLLGAPFPKKTSFSFEGLGRCRQRKNRGTISNVYQGLPESLASRVLRVADEYRTHPWSRMPGGVEIVVEYQNNDVLLYDKIKKPSAYVAVFYGGKIKYADFQTWPFPKQMDYTKSKISRIFAKRRSRGGGEDGSSFEEIWNSKTADRLPGEILKKFDTQLRGFRGPSILDDDIGDALDYV